MPPHTPGPWAISKLASPDYAPQFAIYAADERKALAIATNNNAQANARLIAAAPQLLHALNHLQANPNDPAMHRLALTAISAATTA